MEYITKNCPKCNGELQIPSNLKSCICMYCGENFEIANTKLTELDPASVQTIEEDYKKAVSNITLLIENNDKLLILFTRDKYHASFENYEQTGNSVLLPVERYAALPDQSVEKVAEYIAKVLVDLIENNIQSMKNSIIGPVKDKAIDRYRFFLTVYTIPMIRHLGYTISEPLADSILEQWCNHHPKFVFKKADFEGLEAGFKRKSFCFITTAVCETLDKADNCYELTTLREFRDNYMQQTQEGQALVEEYYQIAPSIVTYINMGSDSKEKYENIWSEYLQPCITNIEEGRFELCETRYIQMVQELRNRMPYDL